jgi:hypothetical protein
MSVSVIVNVRASRSDDEIEHKVESERNYDIEIQ